MSTRIVETLTYADLNNGVFTPSADTMIGSGITVNRPDVKFERKSHNQKLSQLLGVGCFDRLYFPTAFSDSIVIEYSAYSTTRHDNSQDELSMSNADLEYPRLINKTSVVEDGVRNNINFQNVSDVSPLLARYVMLQQFAGKRMNSRYTLARVLDDYFANYYNPGNISMGGGSIIPAVPWLRLGTTTGNRLDFDEESITIVANGKSRTLSPLESVTSENVSNALAALESLYYTSDMFPIIDAIQTGFLARDNDNYIKRGFQFRVNSNKLFLAIGSKVTQVDWRGPYATAIEKASEAKTATLDIIALITAIDGYESISELLRTTITNNPGDYSYNIDGAYGSSITADGTTVTFPGSLDIDLYESTLNNRADYLVPDEFISTVSIATRLEEVLLGAKTDDLVNKSASTINSMFNYLT